MAVDRAMLPVTSRRWRAMGSDAEVIVVGGDTAAVDRAVARLGDLEARWSRFIDSSEVSRMNRYAGQPVAVSAETLLLVRRSQEAWRFSAGAFDPTVLGALLRAGYDRPFDQLGPAPTSGFSLLGTGIVDVQIDGVEVCIPEGAGFDPGGIGKGLAADMVAEEAMEAGALGVCVNLGGDLRVCGRGPDGEGWTVAVEHPHCLHPLALLDLTDGAVATSTTLRRRWVDPDGAVRHHLIDPQTGQPSTTDVALATTIARFAWVAEALAKAVILAGWEHPFDTLGGTGVCALAVRDSGETAYSSGFETFLRGTVAARICQDEPKREGTS